jgi:hypothetical protein
MDEYQSGKCLNCDAPVPNRRSLYCGERCRQIAELVRYARRKLFEGTYDRADIAEAITIRRSQLVVGFYDKRGRAVSDEVRHELRARSRGRCEKYGSKFTIDGGGRFTVQHTSKKSGFLLEAWGYRCNMKHAQSDFITLSDEQIAFLNRFEFRVHAAAPVLQCDDPDVWPATYRRLQDAARRSVAGTG